jgi:hypothetical protein
MGQKGPGSGSATLALSLKERALTGRSRGSDSLPHLSLLQRKLQAVKQMNMETDRKPVPLGKFRSVRILGKSFQ